LWACKWFYWLAEENKEIICGLTNGFFNSHKRKNIYIYYTFGHIVVFLTHTRKEKKWYCTICDFVSGFFIFVEERKKWYYTLVMPQMVFQLMQQWKGNEITHLWAHKWFFCNSHRWQINITIIHTYGSHLSGFWIT
jgi:hypothetical protein